jgi:hypothetical protein
MKISLQLNSFEVSVFIRDSSQSGDSFIPELKFQPPKLVDVVAIATTSLFAGSPA